MAVMLEAGIARVLSPEGQVLGGGFLVGPQEVVTCAHVVARALGLPDGGRPASDAVVWLDFPLVASGEKVAAGVAVWEEPHPDNSGDIAGLSLAGQVPAGVKATRLVTADDLWYHRFRLFGFPAHHDQGVWVSGRLRGRQAAGWVQMEDATAVGYRVEPGFSGAPVWDDELEGVVGMAVAAEARPEVRASYLIPAGSLVRAWPGIADQARPPCPYRGLLAFRERDAALFFGREETSDQLLKELTSRALVAVVGPSGSGKSSLVFAGAIPRLRQRQDWIVTAMRPAQATSPLAALAAALQPLLEPQMSETQRLRDLPALEAVLEDGRLPQVVDRALAQAGGGQLLLVIDQFEELYALEPEVTRRFVDVIVNAPGAQGRTRPLTIVLTLRADFLGEALQHARFARTLQGSTLVIGQMTRNQLRQAIARPLSGGVTFEAGLIERILDDVGEESGNLPLLEFALTLLWDRQERGTLTHASYDALGGVDGAIARYAEQVYLEELSAADREAARRLLVQLVEPGLATAQIRRVARKSELDPVRWQLAQRLATARLLVASRDSAGVETVELVHEALIPGWARLREWMDADHAFRAWQERLRATVKAWQDSGRDTGGLLRGVALAEAERWLKQRAGDIGPTEQHYIEASRAFQGRSLRRLRILSGALALLAVAALIFGVLTVRESGRAETQSRLATSRYLVSQAEALQETRPDLAILLSVAAFQTKDTPEAADLLVRMASNRRDAQALLTSHAPVAAVAFNPADGRMLVSADPADNAIVFWDVPRRARVATIRASGVSELAFSPDGQVLASGGERLNEVRLWDPRRYRALGSPLRGAQYGVRGLTFSPDGRMLAGCGSTGIALWDLQKRALQQRVQRVSEQDPQGFGTICRIGFTSHGRHLAYAAGGRVVTWDIARQAIHRAVPVLLPPDIPDIAADKPKIGNDFTASPDGNVAMLQNDGPVLWDLRRAALIATFPRGALPAEHAAFSQDGRTLAYTTGASTHVIDVTRGISTRIFAAHKIPAEQVRDDGVSSVALSPDGQMIAVGGRDGTIALVRAGNPGALPVASNSLDFDAVFSADGRRLLTATIQDGIQAWDLARRTRVGPSTAVYKTRNPFGQVALSPDGRLLAVNESLDRRLSLWDVKRRIRLGDPLPGVTGYVRSLAFSPDGRILAWADDRNVILWDVAQRTRITALPRQAGDASLGFSPDGRRLAIATDGPQGRIVLWDVARRPSAVPWVTGGDWGNPVFSPDGRWLAVGSSSGIGLWDVPTRKLVTTLPRHGGAVFSPDSRLLAASTPTGEVAIWNVGSRTRIATLDIGYQGNALRFSPNSKVLVAISDDGVTLQRFDTSWAVRHLCQIVHRDMTAQEWSTFVPGRAYHRSCT